jgi:hypothetical protein
MELDFFSANLFVFCNRKRDKLKPPLGRQIPVGEPPRLFRKLRYVSPATMAGVS